MGVSGVHQGSLQMLRAPPRSLTSFLLNVAGAASWAHDKVTCPVNGYTQSAAQSLQPSSIAAQSQVAACMGMSHGACIAHMQSTVTCMPPAAAGSNHASIAGA